jgi:hypothetical protein
MDTANGRVKLDMVLAHHGIKGMKWGVHESKSSGPSARQVAKTTKATGKIDSKIARSETARAMHQHRAENLKTHLDDIEENGLNSKAMRQHYGKSLDLNNAVFYGLHGKTKALALAQKHHEVRNMLASEAYLENHHEKKIERLKNERGKMNHSAIMTLTFTEARTQIGERNLDDVLAHHGVKGMKWGSRKSGGSSSPSKPHVPVSADHMTVEAHKATIREGGVKALSNHQLQQVVTRQNLEQQHRNLNYQHPTKLGKGHDHVRQVLKIAKTAQEIHGLIGSPAGKALKTVIKTAANR